MSDGHTSEHACRGWVFTLEHESLLFMDSAGQVASIDRARRTSKRRKTGLTESERQVLLAEVARISAELGELQVWAAEITRRVTGTANERTDRTA